MTGFGTAPVQQQTINVFGGISGSPATITTTATLANSLIVVEFTNQLASGNALSVTDNIGNTYQLAIANVGTSQRHVEVWYCLKAAAGVTSITINESGASSVNIAGTITEWAGGADSIRATNSANNASSTTPASVTVAPQVGDLVLGDLSYQAAVANTRQETFVTGSFTQLTPVQRGTTVMHNSAYRIATATTAIGPTWTFSPAVSSGAATVAFVPAATTTDATITAVTATATSDTIVPTVSGTAQVSGSGPAVATASTNAPSISSSSVYFAAPTDALGITDNVITAISRSVTIADSEGITDAPIGGNNNASPPAVVQTSTGTNPAATGGTCAFAASTAGNSILLVVTRTGGLSTGQITGVTDNASGGSNAYTLVGRGAVSGQTNTRIEAWLSPKAKSASSASFTSGTSQAGAFEVIEISNLTGTVDAASPDNSGQAAAATVTTPTVSALAGSIVFAFAHHSLTTDPLNSSGFTALPDFDDAAGSGRGAYQVAPSAGSYFASWGPMGSNKPAGTITLALIPSSSSTSGTNYVINVNDNVGITDSTSSAASYSVAPSDLEAITDSVSTLFSRIITANDPEAITDSASSTLSFVRNLIDAEAITDSLTSGIDYARSLADGVGVTDSITTSAVANYVININDSVSIADSTQTNGVSAYSVVIADSVNITDSTASSGTYGYSVTINDSVSATDSPTTSATFVYSAGPADSVGLTDSVTTSAIIVYSTTKSDPVGINDSVTTALSSSYTPALVEPEALTDTVSAIIGGNEAPNLTEAVTIGDSLVIVLTKFKPPIVPIYPANPLLGGQSFDYGAASTAVATQRPSNPLLGGEGFGYGT